MLKTQRCVGIVITYEREHRLGQIYRVCCYLILFVSGTCIVSNRRSHSKVLYKKGTPKISVKPTWKHLHQRLPFNKEETLALVLSCEICKILKNIPPYRALPGAVSIVTLLKMTELSPGLERKIIIYQIMWCMLLLCYVVQCCFFIDFLFYFIYFIAILLMFFKVFIIRVTEISFTCNLQREVVDLFKQKIYISKSYVIYK